MWLKKTVAVTLIIFALALVGFFVVWMLGN